MGSAPPATAVILAAGMGTRMKSSLPKALHPIAGRPMLRHLLDSAAEVFDRIVVVIGPDMPALAAAAAPYPVVVQHERLGTAHAALQAAPAFAPALPPAASLPAASPPGAAAAGGDVAVLYADNPLITSATLQRLLDRRRAAGATLALLAMRPPDPGRYGRVLTQGETVTRVVEWADATGTERAQTLCNAGVLCAPAAAMAGWLRQVGCDNAAGEYYLTDVVALAAASDRVVAVEADYEELRGINTRAELAQAELVVQHRLRAAAMTNGVTMTDPPSVFLCADTQLAPDVTIGPSVVFGPGVRVETGAEIRAFSHLEGCTIGAGAIIGPFARLRPGARLGSGAHVGNFVEIKAAEIGEGAKVNHLSYVGDAAVGPRTNIGAGTITCNYDGFAKHRTTIGADAFVGSDSVLVAPVTIGDRALVTAGSVITDDVPADAMAFGRARQHTRPGRALAFRAARRPPPDPGKA